MKEIIITSIKHGKNVVQVDDEDFHRVNEFKWGVDKLESGTYVKRKSKHQWIRLHRFILDVNDSEICVDHKDHNGLNNQKSNLRIASKKQNNQNTSSHVGSTSKYLGVCWSDRYKKWRANIRIDGKQTHVGLFQLEDDAAKAYDTLAIKARGEFANLNFKTA